MFRNYGNYDARCVLRFEDKAAGLLVSTARVYDGFKLYETAIKHPWYNGNKIIIVEAYDDPNSARAGHGRWCRAMTQPTLPAVLVDCGNCELGDILKKLGQNVFPLQQPKT